jgi:hypothetical protein
MVKPSDEWRRSTDQRPSARRRVDVGVVDGVDVVDVMAPIVGRGPACGKAGSILVVARPG